MRIPKTVLAVLFAGLLAPAAAAARAVPADEPQARQKQTLDAIKKDTPQDAVVGFLGVNYGGGLYGGGIYPTMDVFGNPRVYGVSLLYRGSGIFASEIDLGYNPGFYDGLPVVSPDGESTMYTLTLNMVVAPTFYIGQGGRIRPYGLFGGGLMRSSISEFRDFLSLVDTKNLFTWDWGVGIYVYPVRQIGFRGEFRRFQAVGTNNLGLGWGEIKDWNYYRLTIGLALAF
jgi:opacity protein-like surface antigen